MATVVAVVGTIAGAGTTTVVTALGTALGEQRRRAALVDATAEGSRLTDAIGIEGGREVTDALRRGTTVGDVQADAPHDLAVFPAEPGTNWGAVRPDAVAGLYDQLRDRFEFVLVDCGNEPSVDRAAWLGHADEVVIVTDPDVAGEIPETVALAGAFDVPVRGVLASRVPPKEVADAIEVLRETDQTVLGILPEDPTVGAAAEAGTSVLRAEPDSPIANCAWKLALRFRQNDHGEPVVPTGTVPDSIRQTDEDAVDGGAGDGETTDESPDESLDDAAAGAESPVESSSDPAADGTAPGPEAETSSEPSADTTAESEPSLDATAESEPSLDATAESETDAPTSVDTEDRDDAETADEDERSASTSAEADAFETPDPQPVEEAGSTAAGSDHDGGEAPGRRSDGDGGDGRDGAEDEQGDEQGDEQTDRRATGGASVADPSNAASRSDIGNSESKHDDSGGIDGLDPGLSSDGEDTDEDEVAGDDEANGGTDASSGNENGEESAELSDDEIEAVFQETMQRVKERRETEENGE